MAREYERGRTAPRRAGLLGAAVLLGLSLGLLVPQPEPQAPAAEPAPAAATRNPLPVTDPVAFLEKCLRHFDGMQIRGYRMRLHKQERLDGRLQPSEDIEVSVRRQPYSIFMRWLRGQRRADRALYVEGENGGKILVHPTGLVGDFVKTAALDPDSLQVKEASRFGIQDLGLRKTLARTLDAWRAGQQKGAGRIEYRGVVRVREAGDRPCYALRRTVATPEEGVSETTAYIDRETWFQVGTVLEGPGGELVGAYFDRDI
ncbi:MAG TPA: DUF1571 domain-containing protein, partial [Gemmataceae bacterium]|nr:DUF1571 domain-containing protein [Gemmataceae bacterium]